MALAKAITKLDSAEPLEKEELYTTIAKLLLENVEPCEGINYESIKKLCTNILDDLRTSEKENPQLVKLLQSLLQSKSLQKYFIETDRIGIFKDVISSIDSSRHENALINYFSILIQMPCLPNVEDSLLRDLLQRIDDVLSNRKDPATNCAACNYFQKFLKDYEERLSNFIPLLSKIVFLPLCHSSNKVREVAEKNLDMFPKILLYSSDETATSSLLKLLKESYCKEMLQLFKEKQETYVLKVWTHVVKALGNALSTNLPSITPFFQVIEKGFKSTADDICIASFIAWKSLIDSFSGIEGALNDSKRLRFMLKPFKNISRSNENILSVACDTWMHLAWNLAEHLSDRFSEVCIPLLELTVGKISNGLSEKICQKGGSVTLLKKSCYILIRFLELPPNESFSRLASPKKLPHIPYPTLQTPLDIKKITHHFKELLYVLKVIIDTCGMRDDMKPYFDCLMKSILLIVSTVIEDSNKESAEAVNHFLNFLSDTIDAKIYPPQACLKCVESLSKLPRKVLVSHSFNCGSRKPQDILCNSLLKMLLSPHLFPCEYPKRFFATYNRLIQAGIQESFHPLSNAHKFMHVIRNAIGTVTVDCDHLIELWSGIAGTLLEVIEKTQEVNQGDKQEHDFSCMYDVLLFPFEFIFPMHIQQFRIRPVTKLWSCLYKAFICATSLVATTSVNEACENFCMKLKSCLKDDMLKKSHFMELFCLFMQSIMDSIDFVSGGSSGTQGMVDLSIMLKRKKPLGNLTSFVDLLVILLKSYHSYFVDAEEDSLQSSAPAIQRKVHIVKTAAPLDILKTFYCNLKTGSIISLSLEQLVDPIVKLFMKSNQKRNLCDSKLEMLWNILTSSIERYYLGPYDSEFLALMSPLLEATFSHPRRNIKEKSRRFWFATFGPNASSLKFPDSLKNLLKKMKLPLLPDDISSTEFSNSPMPDSLPEDSSSINPSPVPLALTKPFKSPVSVNGEVTKVIVKENKQSPKIPIDDLPSEEFVKIDSPIMTTPRRYNRKRRSYVPTLYNDLSQDTATMMSSSESQDTTNSTTLDENVLKESVVEFSRIAPSDKELPSTSHNNAINISRNTKSVVSKHEEMFDKTVNKGQVINVEEKGSPTSPVTSSETKTENPEKHQTELTDLALEEKNAESLKCDKISVFSKAGEKCLIPRNTRRQSRLSQSFTALSTEKNSGKMEFQKMNKSCMELVFLGDSDDIIPSSQGSAETENGIKLSINNEPNKSQQIHDSNVNTIEKPLQHCLSPLKEIEEDNSQILMTENVHFITSTPSKSNLPSLAVVDEISNKNNKFSSDIWLKNPDKTEESTSKVIEEEHQKIIPKSYNQFKNSDITKSNEVNKDVSILLDTVDNLVKTTSENANSDSANETFGHSLPDVEMKNVSELEIETKGLTTSADDKQIHAQSESGEMKLNLSYLSADIQNVSISGLKTVTSVSEEKIPSPYEPVAKRSRLSRKLIEKCPQKEKYSQKLRKKINNSESQQEQKPRKKKGIKNDEILNKNMKNKLKSKEDPLEKMDFEIDDVNQICDRVKSKIMNKNKKNSLQSEISKSLENTELKNDCTSNFVNVEVADQSLDKGEINNKTSSQSIENTESCEIFETYSDSSGDFKHVVMTPVDSQSSDGSSQSDECRSGAISSQDCQSPSKKEGIFYTSENTVNNSNCKDMKIKNIDIDPIPSSSENDLGSCFSNEFNSPNGKVKCSDIHSSDPLCEIGKTNIDAKNDNLNSSSVRFSLIEDDLSSEMHCIVDSVVDNSKNNINIDLLENNSTSVEKVQNLQNLMIPLVRLDKGNICDNKLDSTICVKEEHMAKLSSVKVTHIQLSSECEEKLCNSIEEYNSNDVIMSSNTEDDSGNPAQILINSNHENVTEIKLNNNAEKLISQDKSFSPELDHCYSSKSNEDNLSVVNKLEDDSNSLDEIDVVTVDPLCTYSSSFQNFSMRDNEISCLIQDLVIKVEKLDVDNYSSSLDKNHESIVKTDKNIHSNSNHVANKENEILTSHTNNKLTKGSKRRKIKPPIRSSPFNFRQRGKMEKSKKLSVKNIQALNVTCIKSLSESKDLVIKSLFPKDDLKDEDEADNNSMAKIISSIVDSITIEDDMNTDIHTPSSSQMSKSQRLDLSNDELTDLNTRLNAQIAHQTRRMRIIADSQTSAESGSELLHSNVVSAIPEDSSAVLSSILKKRKSSGEVSPKKVRKVTFASPLIHELVFDSCSESRAIDAVTLNRIQNLNKKRKKILQEKNKAGRLSSVQPPVSNESEDIPSSSEYQDSDVLDFSDLPVSPALINCPDDISNILNDLTSQSWVRGLESLLASKNIKTIGDVCKLNIHQVKALPFKSPKVMTLHKALMSYIGGTQEAALQKFKTIDDGSFVEADNAKADLSSANSKVEKMEENSEANNSVLLEETIKDILNKNSLNELPLTLLGHLVEACGKAILEKNQIS